MRTDGRHRLHGGETSVCAHSRHSVCRLIDHRIRLEKEMDASKVRPFAELVGLAAVVISLGLLTWEVSQSNSLAKANVYANVGRDYNEYNLLMASNGEFAELLARLTDEEVELTAVEVQRTIGIGYWNRNAWNSTERAYLEGWIPQDKYQSTLNDIPSR